MYDYEKTSKGNKTSASINVFGGGLSDVMEL